MAIQTRRVASFEGESIVLSFDWDDVTGDVVLARVVNDSFRYGVHVLVQGMGIGAAGRGFEQTFAAASGLTEIAIPSGQQPRYPVGFDRNGEATVEGWRMRAETV